jgi:hypothetical protein
MPTTTSIVVLYAATGDRTLLRLLGDDRDRRAGVDHNRVLAFTSLATRPERAG